MSRFGDFHERGGFSESLNTVEEVSQDGHPHALVQQRGPPAHDTAHGGDHVVDAAAQVWHAQRARISGDGKA